MNIGELARSAEVNIDTIRFYERRGVLPRPDRRPSGYRVYTTATVERLRLARALQSLGFTLDEIVGAFHASDSGLPRVRLSAGDLRSSSSDSTQRSAICGAPDASSQRHLPSALPADAGSLARSSCPHDSRALWQTSLTKRCCRGLMVPSPQKGRRREHKESERDLPAPA